jgi:hypothetical protein
VDSAYVVMDRLPGATLNELTYRRPEVIDENWVTIAYQLGMHMAFSFVFGARDGYQTNYIFNPESRILTRIDKESFLEVPFDADSEDYYAEIASCELGNLKYIPGFRDSERKGKVLYAFKQGFLDKYGDISGKRDELLDMVEDARETWLKSKQVHDIEDYRTGTKKIRQAVGKLMVLDPEEAFDRLIKARKTLDSR